jgi:hypothetical protein
MKQTVFLLIHVFFFLQWESACAQSYEWQRKWGSNPLSYNESVFAEDICMDEFGNTYSISKGNQSVNFSWSGNVNGVYMSGAITKTDSNGNLIWVKLLSGTGASCSPKSINYKNGNIYITGYFSGTIDFDPNNAQVLLSGNGNCFISKMNINGDCLWAQSFGSAGSEPQELDVAQNGDIAITGDMLSQFSFAGQALNYTTGKDLFIVKYDSSGSEIWGQSFGSGFNTDEEGNSLKFLSDNSLVIVGTFENTIDFNYGPLVNNLISNGSRDAFLLKLNNSGGFLNACSFGATNADLGEAVTVDNQNNIILTGVKYGNVDFNPNSGVFILNGLGSNAFICKLQSDFQFIWAKEFESSSGTKGLSISCDNNNDIYTTGTAYGTIDFDPSPISVYSLSTSYGSNLYISKLSAFGNFQYAGLVNNSNSAFEVGTYNYYIEPSRILSSSNSIYISGVFKGAYDFNPDLTLVNNINSAVTQTGIGSQTAFILKLGQCSTTASTQTINSCSTYTWPVNNQTYTSSGIFTDTLLNAAGCDSIVTLNLTINTPVSNNISATSCDSYNWNGNIYSSTGVYTQQFTSVSGCDSTVTLNLTITNTPLASLSSPDGITLNANVVGNATYQWIYCSDLTAITNQTQSQFIPQINGIYAVVISNSCGSDTSECATVNTIGFSELNPSTFQVFPNPSNGLYTITQGLSTEPTEMYLSDVHGRILMRQWINKSSFSIDIQKYKPGTYFIHFGDFGVVQIMKE